MEIHVYRYDRCYFGIPYRLFKSLEMTWNNWHYDHLKGRSTLWSSKRRYLQCKRRCTRLSWWHCNWKSKAIWLWIWIISRLLCYFRYWLEWSWPGKQYIRSLLREHLIPTCFDQDDIETCTFWNPTLRGDNLPMNERRTDTTKTAPIAATVHIDTDISACSNATQLVHLLLSDKNRVPWQYVV